MAQLEHIEAIERRLWNAADTLRANSTFASNEFFLPVMGLVFLRHAHSRYLAVKDAVEALLPRRGGKVRPAGKEDFSQKGAIFLRPEARFDHLVALPASADRARAIRDAMESIENDYENLRGVLPKEEYQELDNEVLGQLLRTLDPEELRHVSGDVFGRIYEYFLTQFAGQGAHDGGEFFTPVSLVSLIANVIEPGSGTVLDPACGSGGMFVQSARVVERGGGNPADRLTFYGLEKNATTIRLAKMNLAVHGLEGDIRKAITYYEDPHELLGKADFVMANPPFNVDEIDAAKVKSDPRLPFGLPGVNKAGRVQNGNYVWISYFHSYLGPRGRAGFVMSSQASSAGRDEALVRRRLAETGDVDAMVAVRGNFFYTRTVPCELWFLDRGKPAERRGRVLMLDARSIYRKVTRKIYDFSPDQEQNLLAVFWLYRGQEDRFRALVEGRCRAFREAGLGALDAFRRVAGTPADALEAPAPSPDVPADAAPAVRVAALAGEAGQCRALLGGIEEAAKAAGAALDAEAEDLGSRELARRRKALEEARAAAVAAIEDKLEPWSQADWLVRRFPDARYRDVEGLCKAVTLDEIAANDWSLTPGRYVGVAPDENDEADDFAEKFAALHAELRRLDAEAAELAAKIDANFKELMG
jgi:type I restriction enzyme M protein